MRDNSASEDAADHVIEDDRRIITISAREISPKHPHFIVGAEREILYGCLHTAMIHSANAGHGTMKYDHLRRRIEISGSDITFIMLGSNSLGWDISLCNFVSDGRPSLTIVKSKKSIVAYSAKWYIADEDSHCLQAILGDSGRRLAPCIVYRKQRDKKIDEVSLTFRIIWVTSGQVLSLRTAMADYGRIFISFSFGIYVLGPYPEETVWKIIGPIEQMPSLSV